MKRILCALLLMVLVVSLVLNGCSKPAPSPTPAPAPAAKPAASPTAAAKPAAPASPTAAPKPPTPAASPAPKPVTRIPFEKQELPKFIVGNAAPGGIQWVTVSGWADIISKYTAVKGSVTVNPGFKAAIEPMRKGEIDFGQGSPSQPWAAYAGSYEKEGIKKLRLRLLFGQGNKFPGVFGVFALKRSNIKSGADLKGKKVGVHAGVNWAATMAKGIAAANGFTDKDYTAVNYSTIPDGMAALLEGKVDCFIATAGSESMEASKTADMLTLALTKAETEAIQKLDATLTSGMTPGNNYQGTGDSKWGITAYFGLWSRADLSEKAAYTMVQVLFDHIKEFQALHERATDVSLETAIDNLWLVPYHPGVVRYYQEKGIWKPEHTAKQKAAMESERKLYGDVPDEDLFQGLGIK